MKEKLPSNQCNYSKNKITLQEIKQYDLFFFLEAIGASLIKKKSSKYGRYYKSDFGRIWARYDYSTGYYFYCNLDNQNDKGTLIDFIQNNIIKEKNLGKVKKYFKEFINA